MKEERKAKEKARKETSGNNSSGGTSYNGWLKPNCEDRSHLKCTYLGCGKTGHTEENLRPRTPPKSLMLSRTGSLSILTTSQSVWAVPQKPFKDTYSRPDSLGMAPSPALHINTADTSPQMCSVGMCRKL